VSGARGARGARHAGGAPAAPRVVTLTGPESTGKTTLAETIARAHGAPWSGEFSRTYLERRLAADPAASLGPDDVEAIARGQIAGEDAALADAVARDRPLVVRDTDLASTVVYARHYYGECPAWIVAVARARRAALYLLCAPDLPWTPDGIRDRPHARESLHAEFRAVLDELGCRYVEVRGSLAEREAIALGAVERMVDGV
jgi:NadR type nicotinamide-nucleotide adenylyltransferase